MAMGRELDNANPTIVNVSDLPTRRREKRNKVIRLVGDDGARWSTSHGIFDDTEDHRADGDSDDGGDPIDEQEIFGKYQFFDSPAWRPWCLYALLLALSRSPLLRESKRRSTNMSTNTLSRSDCHHFRSRAPSYSWPARGGQPSRYPYRPATEAGCGT